MLKLIVLAGATNTPIAASILALELIGPEFAAYAVLGAETGWIWRSRSTGGGNEASS